MALSDSGRSQLALRPAQAAQGGRLFVFAKVPPSLADASFDAEFLVWRRGNWQRSTVVKKEAGKLGHLTAMLVIEGQEPGPVPTAVFRRAAEYGKGQSVVSGPIEVPSNSRLAFGYSLDEWDWSNLSPVDVTVTAVVPDKKTPSEEHEVRIFRERYDPAGRRPGWVDVVAALSAVKGEGVRFIFRADPVYVE